MAFPFQNHLKMQVLNSSDLGLFSSRLPQGGAARGARPGGPLRSAPRGRGARRLRRRAGDEGALGGRLEAPGGAGGLAPSASLAHGGDAAPAHGAAGGESFGMMRYIYCLVYYICIARSC